MIWTVQIIVAPTLREPDGLAMSSRNQYLSPEDRARAPAIHAALKKVADGLRSGRRDFEALCQEQLAGLIAQGFRPQYLEVRAPDLSTPVADDGDFAILIAAHLGPTRLIDNLQLRKAA